MDSAVARIEAIERALRGPLPGPAAQRRMWPDNLPRRTEAGIPADARLASVLVLLYPLGERVCLPLLRRTAPDGDPHAGQISLPGGRKEGDERPEDTALREAQEELGIDPASVRILGRLTRRWIPVSYFKVQTIVACVRRVPEYHPDPVEVDEVLVTSLEELEDPRRISSFTRELRGERYDIPCWRLDGGILWGATAMILSELLALNPPLSPSARPPGS